VLCAAAAVVPIERLATTSLQRLRSGTGPWPGGGRLARLVEQAPATHQEPSVGPEGGGWPNAEEVNAVLSAYVLILTEVGKVAHVAQAVNDLDGVESAEDLAGPYDVIARIQAPGLDQLGRLGRLVVSRIQLMDGVTRTLTCTVIRR